MYAEGEAWHISLNGLDNILEGKIRPGHYQGVTQIVKKLFDTVMPDKAFFGQKDYQQIKVISELVRQYRIPVELVMCPIIREADGLAMSSRNVHLSADEHRQALVLSRALNLATQIFPVKTVQEVKDEVTSFVRQTPGVDLEYFEICDQETLQPVITKGSAPVVALIAARVGSIRLIDNIILQ
jgi:pantoate--beta-alanine ligase